MPLELTLFPLITQVQLQLLTAIVKLFLKKPTETQELVQQVLSLATQVREAISLVAHLCSLQWGMGARAGLYSLCLCN